MSTCTYNKFTLLLALKMSERKALFVRLLLFLGMAICFSIQSLDSFKKYVDGKTSITESDIERELEPLPSFSVCSEPPFDSKAI